MFSVNIASVKDWDAYGQELRPAAINVAESQIRSLLPKLRHSYFRSHNFDPLRGNFSYQCELILIWVRPVLKHARRWAENQGKILSLLWHLFSLNFPIEKQKIGTYG